MNHVNKDLIIESIFKNFTKNLEFIRRYDLARQSTAEDVIVDCPCEKNLTAVFHELHYTFFLFNQAGVDTELLKKSAMKPLLDSFERSGGHSLQEHINLYLYDIDEVDGSYVLLFKDDEGNEFARMSSTDTIYFIEKCQRFLDVRQHIQTCECEPSVCNVCSNVKDFIETAEEKEELKFSQPELTRHPSRHPTENVETDDGIDKNTTDAECAGQSFPEAIPSLAGAADTMSYDTFDLKIKDEFDELNNSKISEESNQNCCIKWKTKDGEIKHHYFSDRTMALKWAYAYNNKASMKEELPVVLIADISKSKNSKGKKNKNNKSVSVGREVSPNCKAVLKVPGGKSEMKKTFYIDTGADDGSVGYQDNPEFRKSFIFSMEEIENDLKPVVFAQIEVEGHTFPIQTFDVDPDPLWNALGMIQLKKFVFYHSSKDGITLLVNPQKVKKYDHGRNTKVVITTKK